MNRLIAPAGMALLSLTLAAVPVLLNATGTELRFCSRLASIGGAWNQITNVFLAVYQPSNAAQLLALGYGTDDKSPASECSGHRDQIACLDRADAPEEPGKASDSASLPTASELLWIEQPAGAGLQPVRCSKSPSDRPLKRFRTATAPRIAAGPPIHLPRIDVLKVIEAALKTEAATSLFDKHLTDYRIPSKSELKKFVTRLPMPAAFHLTTKGAAPRCESEPEHVQRPDVQIRERIRKARLATTFELQS